MGDEKIRLMAVVCHPADAIDHAGGTLALHAERGDEVTVVVCTHGVESHDFRRHEAIRGGGEFADLASAIERKEQEVRKGLGILGVTDVRFLRLPDELITVSRDLVEAIAEQLADVQPHLLILHNPTEHIGLADAGHADTALAALKSLGLMRSERFQRKSKGGSFPVQIFLCEMYGSSNQLQFEGMRHGNFVVDITSVVDKKVRAMDCLQSQFYTGELARKLVEDVNGRMGLHMRMPYAESFQTYYPHGGTHLPLNEYLYELSRKSLKERLRRMRVMVDDIPLDES